MTPSYARHHCIIHQTSLYDTHQTGCHRTPEPHIASLEHLITTPPMQYHIHHTSLYHPHITVSYVTIEHPYTTTSLKMRLHSREYSKICEVLDTLHDMSQAKAVTPPLQIALPFLPASRPNICTCNQTVHCTCNQTIHYTGCIYHHCYIIASSYYHMGTHLQSFRH